MTPALPGSVVAATSPESRWRCARPSLTVAALHAAALFAVDPVGTGGAVIRALPGPARDGWLQRLSELLPEGTPVRRVPLHINDERLLGGLDLAATLQAGRPIAQQGVLTLADGGVAVLAMAERLAPATAARLAAVLDTQEVALERDGLATRHATRFGVIALDEGLADDERVAPALIDRLAFSIDLHPLVEDAAHRTTDERALEDELASMPGWSASDVAAARALLPQIDAPAEIVQALVSTALALGVASLRAPLLAVRVARASAALDGRLRITDDDAQLAAALVLAPRATQVPAPPADQPPDDAQAPPEPEEPEASEDTPEPPAPEDGDDTGDDDDTPEPPVGDLEDRVLEAAQAAIPAGLLAALMAGQDRRSNAQASGRAGAVQQGCKRGRPSGARRGEPRAGARLNVIETLRAAAPWQKIRHAEVARAQAVKPTQVPPTRARVQVRRDDFHVTRYKQRSATTTVFVVDASGSSALNRLAEAKGAVELLLADCYVRRDQVAVLAFRGKGAELLLPPTRSLVRAKRSLAGLPGGGGTPLASGIDAAAALAESIARRGETPIVVLLTDGRGNIARDGSPGRARAGDDVQQAARQFRAAQLRALLIDTSPQPQAAARQLAQEMGASYLPLPYAGASALSQAVALATKSASAAPLASR
ncbi:MAG: magnesium chelatase ATPase subunit D [Burkholderiales bacterium PBB1]|nr:MAG: magnesium chelatase ATPase subunit D [Burkholderiales bacterium PBB1]